MQLLFKFQVNRMKIDNFRKSAYVVILAYDDLKNIGGWIQRPDMQILFKFQVNRMKIEDFRNLT